jgi:hypothetical protein
MAATLNLAQTLKSGPLLPPGLDARGREMSSHKLYGYEFVNYRSECEESNSNGLIKYTDVVNYGRRISDLSGHNCVMCGAVDVVIPTQNKDVCKSCDSSFWYNAKLNVAFKFCKGCKNFVTLEMFADKPDASKCCRCRRRGRENYLTKKYSEAQEVSPAAHSPFPQGGFVPSPIHMESAVLASPTTMCAKVLDSLRSGLPPTNASSGNNVCTPHFSSLSAPQFVRPSFTAKNELEGSASVRKLLKKRTLSVDDCSQGPSMCLAKTPRSASTTQLDAAGAGPAAVVTGGPSASGRPTAITRTASFGTPGGVALSFVTPGSQHTSRESTGDRALSDKNQSGVPGVVGFTRSDSVSSTTPSGTTSLVKPLPISLFNSSAYTSAQHYLWERTSFHGSPQVDRAPTASTSHSLQLPSIRSLQQLRAPTDLTSGPNKVPTPTVRFAECAQDSTSSPEVRADSPSNKENYRLVGALSHLPLFRDDPLTEKASPRDTAGKIGVERSPTCSVEPPAFSQASTPRIISSGGGAIERRDSLSSSIAGLSSHSSDSEGSPRAASNASAADVGAAEVLSSGQSGASPSSTHWEWDPQVNPLMHLAAMISQHR